MNELFIYLVKAAVINAIILAFYHFAFRKSNKFQLMRATLLLAMILPLLLPLIPYPTPVQHNFTTLPVITITLPETAIAVTDTGQNIFNNADLPGILYYGVSLVLLLGMVISISSIIRKRIRSKEHITSFGRVEIEHSVRSPFSFFSWVFLSPFDLEHPQLDMILSHEFCHVKEKHSFDRILSGIFRSVLWFSPIVHITSRLLSEVHEYQADSRVIGVYERSDYSDLILSFYLNPNSHSMSNNFSLHIKKRIQMINKFKSTKISLSRVLTGLCLSLIFIMLTAMVKTGNPDVLTKPLIQNDEVSFTPGDTIPPSPDITPWTGNIDQKGPLGHAGTVIITVDILPDGTGSNFRIYQSAGEVLDNFALNKIKQINEWKPATYEDKPVKYTVFYPFNFTEDGDVNITFPEGGAIIVETEKPITFEKSRNANSSDPDTIQKVNKSIGTNNSMPDSPPQFPGGDKARVEYTVAHTQYPDDARKAGIEGTVYIQFVVTETGEVDNVIIMKGVHQSLDRIANTAIKNMPRWIPAVKDNRPVSYQMTMPIKFELSDKDKSQLKNSGSVYNPATEPVVPQKNEGMEIFTVVEVAPQFPGGDDARIEFISKNISYPEQAKKEGIQGTVYITFVVQPDGSITDAKVLRGIGGGLDEIAIAAVQKMPKWEPGKVKGEPVPVQFNMPIKFKLTKDEVKPAQGSGK